MAAVSSIFFMLILIITCAISNAFVPYYATRLLLPARGTEIHLIHGAKILHSKSILRYNVKSLSSLRAHSTDYSVYVNNVNGDLNDNDPEVWISLVNDTNSHSSVVRKRILSEGAGDIMLNNEDDAIIELRYTGSLLGERNNWSTHDVVQCWLTKQQGLDYLAPKFIELDINGTKLMDESYFTENFCMVSLGMENKVQVKKLVMASRRLIQQQVEYPPGTIFDSSDARGDKNYTFVLKKQKGGSNVIPAMELAVRSMKVGERALLICRSDYAYGSEGLRSSVGQVVVPPFSVLCFDLTLINTNTKL